MFSEIKKMKNFLAVYLPLLVWLAAFGLFGLFVVMYGWAKKQKGAAIALGMLVQMFLPDPKAQQTIEFVVEAKQKESKQSMQSQTNEDD
jgi:hypothetical protein